MADSDDLTDEQHEQLENDVINRQPIGHDEILLYGDVRKGLPVLKQHFDIKKSGAVLRTALETDCPLVAAFLAWTRTSPEDSFKTLMEVQRLRDLVREAESAVIAG